MAACAEAGYGGLSLFGPKVPNGREEEFADLLRRSGVDIALVTPGLAGPLRDPFYQGPSAVDERIELICAEIDRLAPFGSKTLALITGSPDSSLPDDGRPALVNALRTISDHAGSHGMSVTVEPIANAMFISLIHTPAEAVQLIREVNRENLGMLIDISNANLWTNEQLLIDIDRFRDNILAVQVADWRAVPRCIMDRALPGEGVADFPAILARLEGAGFQGWYDLEVFSDDGIWGTALEDSLLLLPEAEMLAKARQSFEAVWPGHI
ncbi:MAG: sugar phosphate isomerase/epimerase family protein [Sphingobium sp.]|uniref:sugar phosphate isomerase/epimerase family protein n=1 Tax=Sphingobium sp. TaxID=1912891 RepID=UPI0029A20B42|nr:sugar phosphate isomerase/epimerase family protein [Sphingobium sp.]MDX3910595.1 sugar phosphate isomerase/epimerase family protein [Sphingobium sp.]